MKAERLLLLIQIIQDEAELYQFCNEKLTVLGSDEYKKMLNRLFYFFYISQEMM